jgi:hypothetical protein
LHYEGAFRGLTLVLGKYLVALCHSAKLEPLAAQNRFTIHFDLFRNAACLNLIDLMYDLQRL